MRSFETHMERLHVCSPVKWRSPPLLISCHRLFGLSCKLYNTSQWVQTHAYYHVLYFVYTAYDSQEMSGSVHRKALLEYTQKKIVLKSFYIGIPISYNKIWVYRHFVTEHGYTELQYHNSSSLDSAFSELWIMITDKLISVLCFIEM